MSAWPTRLVFACFGLVLAAPLAVVAGVSVNAKKSLTFPPEGFSLAWFTEIFANPEWFSALLSSIAVAASASALAVLIALPIAWFLWRWHAPFARIVQVLGLAPFILPPVITALGFLAFWSELGLYGEPWTVVISHGIFFVTLPLVTLTLGFDAIDAALIEAAATMGADEKTVLRTIVFPLIRPYVVSGLAFAFVLSLNEYIVAYMVVGFTVETLPIKIFNALRYGYTPTMAAVTVLFVAVAALAFGLIARFGDLPRLLGAWSPKDE